MLGLLKVGLGVNWIAQSSVNLIFLQHRVRARARHGRVCPPTRACVHGRVPCLSLFPLLCTACTRACTGRVFTHGQYTGVYLGCVFSQFFILFCTRSLHGRVSHVYLPNFFKLQALLSKRLPIALYHLIHINIHRIESESFLRHFESILNT